MAEGSTPRAERYSDSLHASIMAGDDGFTPSSARPLALALSVLVLVTTWALVIPAVWLMVAIPFRLLGIVLGLVVLGVWWSVLPRRPRLPGSAVLVGPEATELRALLDRIGAAVGTSTPRTVAVTPWINAAVLDRAKGGGRSLVIGAPLWLALSPQARVAVLAHEFAHYSSGDTRRTSVTGAAFSTLQSWRELLDDPLGGRRSGGYDYNPNPSGSLVTVSIWGARVGIWLVGLLPLALSWALVHATSRDSQRAEYRADRLAAETAGVAGMREALTLLQRYEALDAALQRASLGGTSTLAAAREFDLASLAPMTGPGHHHAPEPFDSHPPLPLRLEAIGRLTTTATVVLDTAASDRIDAELAATFAKVEPALRDRYR